MEEEKKRGEEMISINFWWKIRVERVKFRESLGKEEGDRTGIGAAEGEREKGKQAHALLDSEKPVPELVTGQFNPGR